MHPNPKTQAKLNLLHPYQGYLNLAPKCTFIVPVLKSPLLVQTMLAQRRQNAILRLRSNTN